MTRRLALCLVLPLAERVIAHDHGLFIFNPDSKATVGWDALAKDFEFWMDALFTACKWSRRSDLDRRPADYEPWEAPSQSASGRIKPGRVRARRVRTPALRSTSVAQTAAPDTDGAHWCCGRSTRSGPAEGRRLVDRVTVD